MAQRFRGRFSPDNPQTGGPGAALPARRPTRVGARANFLFIAPLPLVITAFGKDPVGLALTLAGFATLMLAAWLTREGLRAQEAYEARRVARRPAIPRKIFGSVLTGAGLVLAGMAGGHGPVSLAIFAGLGAALHFTAFGPDPLADKNVEGVDSFQSNRVARAVDEAEAHLAAMREFIRRTGDRHLLDRVDAFQANVRALIRSVENDPRRLTAARRYLGVYLLGARDASEKFASLYTQNARQGARAEFERLLDDLDTNFTARTQALLSDDRQALDIEMEVLRERLQREGLRPETG